MTANNSSGFGFLTEHAVILGGTLAGSVIKSIASIGTSGQLLTSNGAGVDPSFQAAANGVTVTQFDANGTWTKGTNTKAVDVYIWSGGGAGGSGRRGASTAAGGGGGGGGGAFIQMSVPATFFGATEAVTIGATSTGGAAQVVNATDGNAGANANYSQFGKYRVDTVSFPGGGAGGINGSANAGSTALGYIMYQLSGNGSFGGTGELTNGNASPPIYPGIGGSTGAGGGSGADAVVARTGGAGGNQTDPYNITTTISGGAGGVEGGTINGSAGTAQATGTTAGGIIAGGTGGGGGGGQSVGASAGIGGAGGIPGGGGGGGGGSLNGTASGAGGNGARGRVIVVEYA